MGSRSLVAVAFYMLFPQTAQLAEAQRAPRLERVATIGCDECGDARAFSEVVDVAITEGGTIWVANAHAPKLRAFTLAGTPVRAFGAHGRGPGEISALSRMFVAGGRLSVIDPLTNQVSGFDTLGRGLGALAVGRFAVDAAVEPGSGDLLMLTSRFTPGSSAIERLAIGAAALTPLLGPLTDFPTVDRPSEAHAFALSADGRMALTEAGTEYRIVVYERDGRRRDIVRDLPRTKYSPAEHAAMERRRARGSQLRASEAARGGRGPGGTPPLPTEKPHLRWGGLRFDESGRLWVLTGRGTDGEAVVDLYDRALTFMGEVRIPGVVGRFAIGADHLVTSGEDDDGVPVVTVWRLVP